MADYLPPVVAKLQGDDASLTRTLATSKDKVKRWAVEVGKTKVTLTVDAKLRDGAAERIQQRIGRINGTATVGLRIDEAQQRRISAQMQRGPMTVPVKPVMDQEALRRVKTVLRELGKRIDVSVRPQMDDRSQRRVQTRLDRLSRNRTVTIRTRVIGGGTPNSGASRTSRISEPVQTLISLAPALTPIAAVASSAALSLTAGTVAVGAFGLAVKSQLGSLGAAADAQGKYNAAVSKYGAYSKQAQQAQEAAATALDGMPAATQRAAMGFLHLKDDFKGWSDGLATFTMQPVLHSFAVAEQILPKLSPLVKDTSGQLDRLVTIAGGAVNTPGFDRMMGTFTEFADGALKHATDDLIHFTRVLSEGDDNGPVSQFLAYAKAEGPQVKQTMGDIARAVETLLKASSEAGPGMLTLVDDVAKLVAALPPSFVARVMQAYAAFRLFKLANTGITGVTTAVTTLSTRLTALRAASAAAGGGVRGVGAAVGTLSTGAKVAGAVGVIAGLAYAAYKLTDNNKQARISVDDLSRSIEAGLSHGKIATPVLDELRQGLAGVLKETDASASAWDKIGYSFTHWGSKWSSSASSAKAVANAQRDLGKAIGEVAQNQGVDKATQALALLNKEGAKVPTKYLKDYNNALADQQFQDQMAANSMGLFGTQAQQVQKKLDAQKQAVQGLQQAILDLNDANRAALDAESAYQQSLDDTTAAIKHHRNALHYSNGELDLGNQKAREAYGYLSQMAASAESVSTAVLQQTGSQDKANRVLIDAHQHLLDAAHAMGLSSDDARRLADQLDNIKDPKIQVTAAIDSAQAAANTIQNRITQLSKMKATPKVRADLGRSQSELANLKQQLDALKSKSVFITLKVGTTGMPKDVKNLYGFGAATGAIVSGGVRRMAEGGFGRPAMMAKGGSNILWGEGPDESYIPHTRNARSRDIAAKTVGILGGSVSWGNGATAAGGNVAAGLARGVSGGQSDVTAAAVAMAKAAIGAFSTEMGIASPSKKFRALGAYTISGLVQGLTGSTASVKAATKRIASMLYTDFGSGHKGLQQAIAKDNTALLKLAGQRDSVASKLKSAQSKLAAVQKQWTDEKNTIASGIMQNASIITDAPDSSRSVNANDVVAQMQQRVKAAQQFAAELDQLRKKGLRSDLIQQLATAGVDQAGATALALSAGSSAQIQQMNQLQGALQTAANSTGTAVADSMYGAGIKSAQGLVKGLQSQEKSIEAQMLKIAKSMQAAIKKALGIKSPSAVMAELGDFTAKGMALGIQRSTKHVAIAASGMAMAARQGAAITGTTGGGYRGGDVHVHLTVQGSVVAERDLVENVRVGLLRGGLRNSGVGLTPKR